MPAQTRSGALKRQHEEQASQVRPTNASTSKGNHNVPRAAKKVKFDTPACTKSEIYNRACNGKVTHTVEVHKTLCKYAGSTTHDEMWDHMRSSKPSGFSELYGPNGYEQYVLAKKACGQDIQLSSMAARTAWAACSMVHFLNLKDLSSIPHAMIRKTGNSNADISLRAHQKRVQDYVLENKKNLRYGLIYHMTGTGKTCTMVAIVNALSSQKQNGQNVNDDVIDRFVFIVPNVSIMDQVIATLVCKCSRDRNPEMHTFNAMKWKGVIWTADGYPTRRAIFITRSSMTEISQVPIFQNWDTRDNTCVFVDEAHDLFVNGSLSGQVKEWQNADANINRLDELLSKKKSEQIILTFTHVRFCVASTATLMKSDPNDIAAYLDSMHIMTRQGNEHQHVIGGITGNVKDQPQVWEEFHEKWKNHMLNTGGFLSMFDTPDATQFPSANYSRLPINIQDKQYSLNADWRSRRVEKVYVENRSSLEAIRNAQLKQNDTLGDVSITKAAKMYKMLNNLKLDKLFDNAKEQYNISKGPILIYTNFVSRGVKLVRERLELNGCKEAFTHSAYPPKKKASNGNVGVNNIGTQRSSEAFTSNGMALQPDQKPACLPKDNNDYFSYIIKWLMRTARELDDRPSTFIGSPSRIKRIIGWTDTAHMHMPNSNMGNIANANNDNSSIEPKIMTGLLARMFHAVHFASVDALGACANELCLLRKQLARKDPRRFTKRSAPYRHPLDIVVSALRALTHANRATTNKNNKKNNEPAMTELFAVIDGTSAWDDDKRAFFLRMFNSEVNHDGSVVKYMVISKAGGTGIDFRNLKQVHILDMDYAPVYLIQAIGRATRDRSLSASSSRGHGNHVVMFSYAAIVNPEEPDERYKYLRTANSASFDAVVRKHNMIIKADEILRGLSIESKDQDARQPPIAQYPTASTNAIRLRTVQNPKIRIVKKTNSNGGGNDRGQGQARPRPVQRRQPAPDDATQALRVQQRIAKKAPKVKGKGRKVASIGKVAMMTGRNIGIEHSVALVRGANERPTYFNTKSGVVSLHKKS